MAFDGIVTRAVARELSEALCGGKIDKIYQPEKDELVFLLHTSKGRFKLYMSSNNDHPGVYITKGNFVNPAQPPSFCMLMRKYLTASYVKEIHQKDSERIIEIVFDTLDDLGFQRPLMLIIEIMGKHSNVILVDPASMHIIDSIKRLSFDINRVRQVLPGKKYQYPPKQDKLPFDKVDKDFLEKRTGDDKQLLDSIMGISPLVARMMAPAPWKILTKMQQDLENGNLSPAVYLKPDKTPADFHIFPVKEYQGMYESLAFTTVSETIEYFYSHRLISNRIHQQSSNLRRQVQHLLKKARLKKQKLGDDLIKADAADTYRVYGELITANLHQIKTGDTKAVVENYYDGSLVTIPLDPRFTPAKNAQQYFKKYNKSKTAIKEKALQMKETSKEIAYLESTANFIKQADSTDALQAIVQELTQGGYLRQRKQSGHRRKIKLEPMKYHTSSGLEIWAGHNNTENDQLTFKTAGRHDWWFHTKDIPGSHVILFANGQEPKEADIMEAAAVAAYHSKGRQSENVPVDYVQVRYVKKPNGAKPGMCIFTNNKTVYVNPVLP